MQCQGQTLTKKEAIEEIKKPQRYFFNGQEKDYENYIKENLVDICKFLNLPPIRHIHQQKQISAGDFWVRLDLWVLHKDDTSTVFEIKKSNRENPSHAPQQQHQAIGQLLLYRNIVEALTGDWPNVFMVDEKIHYKTMLVFNELKLPVGLVEVQKNRVFIPYRGI